MRSKTKNRKTICSPMCVFYSLSDKTDDGKFIEVTEWTNGEGWDISLSGKIISLHWDELEAINILTKLLNNNLGLTTNDK